MLSRPCRKRRPSSRDDGGVWWDFWSCGAGVGFLTSRTGSSGSLSCATREVRIPCGWRGGARHCSRVMEGTRASRRVEEGLSRSFSGFGRKPWVPFTCVGELRELFRVPLRSKGYCRLGRGVLGLHCIWCNEREPHLELRQEPKGSSPFLTLIPGSLQCSEKRVRPLLVWNNGTLIASLVVHGVTGNLSSCLWNLLFFLEDIRGVSAPSLCAFIQGLPLKRFPCIRFLSRADLEIGVFRHLAPSTRLCLEFPHETGLILRCIEKVACPFQVNQVNRPSCCDQEGRRGSDEVEPGTSVYPSSGTSMPGNIWDCIKSAKYRFVLKDRMWDFSRDAIGGMGLIFRYGGTTWFFSSCGEILELRRGLQASSCVGPG